MVIPLVGFLVAFAFPIYLETFCARELDGSHETKIGYHDEHGTIGDKVSDRQLLGGGFLSARSAAEISVLLKSLSSSVVSYPEGVEDRNRFRIPSV